ncbi:MAG: leucine-rich repeat domain-containing protein [Peptococcaceae bacterium]|nr:leucine-rich repeat domain-containing protein [Peptococcaceae bacterium]
MSKHLIRLVAGLGLLTLLVCCAGCDAINNLLAGNKEPEAIIQAEINLEAASDEDSFLWNGAKITGLTDKGKALVNVVVPQKATSIEAGVFTGNTTMKSVGFQNQNIGLPEGLFVECSSLEMALLPANLKVVPDSLFKGCRDLKEIVIPNQVTEIGKMAFFQCISLEKVTHGDKIEVIGRQAFHTCDQLKEFVFSPSIKVIGEGAFSWCYNLESVILTSSELEVLEVRTFSNCSKLAKVVVSEGVKKLDVGVFTQCPKLVEVSLPESLVEIDSGAFKNTAALNAEPKAFKVVEESFADLNFGGYATNVDTKTYQ